MGSISRYQKRQATKGGGKKRLKNKTKKSIQKAREALAQHRKGVYNIQEQDADDSAIVAILDTPASPDPSLEDDSAAPASPDTSLSSAASSAMDLDETSWSTTTLEEVGEAQPDFNNVEEAAAAAYEELDNARDPAIHDGIGSEAAGSDYQPLNPLAPDHEAYDLVNNFNGAMVRMHAAIEI